MMTASLLPFITLPSPAISHLVKHDREADPETTLCDTQPASQAVDDTSAVDDGVCPDRPTATIRSVGLTAAPRIDGKPLIPDPWSYSWHALAIRREFRGRVWSGTWPL